MTGSLADLDLGWTVKTISAKDGMMRTKRFIERFVHSPVEILVLLAFWEFLAIRYSSRQRKQRPYFMYFSRSVGVNLVSVMFPISIGTNFWAIKS